MRDGERAVVQGGECGQGGGAVKGEGRLRGRGG